MADHAQTDFAPRRNDGMFPGGLEASDFAKCLAPFEHARVLPTHAYTNAEFYKFEVENVLTKQWILAGRIDQVANPGDYFTITRYGETAIVVRDFDNRLRAFSAACRHRGYPVASGSGNCGKRGFNCPYHGWRYRLDGSLAAAPFMQEGFDPKLERGLPEFGLDVWQGFIFINFNKDAALLSPQLKTLDKALAPYKMAEMKSSVMREKLWPGNWKATLDNFTEAYHQPYVHPTTFEPMAPTRLGVYEDVDGPYNLFWLPAPEGENLELAFDMIQGMPELHSRSFAVVNVFPMFHMLIDPSCAVLLDMNPLGVDKLHARWDVLVPESTFQQENFEAQRDWLTNALVPTWNEDEFACENVRYGQSSRFTSQGKFSWMEKSVHQLHKWLAERYLSSIEI